MNPRGSGILLHITSLPSPYGIGDLGPEAFRFVDFLAAAQQSYWQVLPLTPTDPISGNSPYSSVSAFAGNPLLISPDLLLETGDLKEEDLPPIPPFPQGRCDFCSVIPYKRHILHNAYERFQREGKGKAAYETFCGENAHWLEDFALYRVIKNHHQGKAWGDWERGVRDRNPLSLDPLRTRFAQELEREKFFQYLFFRQWFSLKAYAQSKKIRFMGDIPIYVNYDSADVWANPQFFKLDEDRKPRSVAGVPPDYFSQTGQRWGNPIYRWDLLEKSGFEWWLRRMAHNLRLFDLLRIDHFRGFVAYWEIPAEEETAIRGQWVPAPANSFFRTLLQHFPARSLIAEDLGVITPDVKEIMERFGFPGMRVLQFAFGGELATHPFLPHNYVPRCIAYPGTHDNNTLRGWFEHEATTDERKNVFRYLGREISAEDLPREMIRLLMMSVAETVISPLQDILGLGAEARMNRPSIPLGNWEWRLKPSQLREEHEEMLLEMTSIYGRSPG
jgi:4-alpha-glucanotransferase